MPMNLRKVLSCRMLRDFVRLEFMHFMHGRESMAGRAGLNRECAAGVHLSGFFFPHEWVLAVLQVLAGEGIPRLTLG